MLLVSYLSDRMQMVVQGNDISDVGCIQVGVPQGSVLGPLLFIISINDFAFNVPCSSIIYADDTTLYNSNKDYHELLRVEKQALDAALNWFKSNFLTVNEQKTEQIIFFRTLFLQGI